MRGPPLFRRRSVWLPTLWGWLALLVVVGTLVVVAARSVHGFLAPVDPVGARILVVEGWMDPEDFDRVVTVFRSGGYERVVTTGGPIGGWRELHVQHTFAEFAAEYLKRHGLADVPVDAVPAPDSAQERTFLNGVMVREWARASGLEVDAIDVFSSGVHSRRSRLLYSMAMGPDVRVGVIASPPVAYDADSWWKTSVGFKSVVGEALSFFWTKCFFRPGPPGTRAERWASPPSGAGRGSDR